MLTFKQKKSTDLDKKRKKLSLLAKHIFDNADISEKELKIKFIAHPKFSLPTF